MNDKRTSPNCTCPRVFMKKPLHADWMQHSAPCPDTHTDHTQACTSSMYLIDFLRWRQYSPSGVPLVTE